MRLNLHSQLALLAFLYLVNLTAHAGELNVTVIDTTGTPITNAVVYAEPVGKPAPKPTNLGVIEQKNKTFIPLVTVVQTGTNINFPNRDLVRHHVYSFSPAKTFELKLYSGVPANPVMFDTPGTVVLGCNIHDTMLAYIHIVDTPYFAKTDNTGKVKLNELPAGQYIVKVWHYDTTKENLISEQAVTIKSTESLEFKLDIKKK